MSSTPKAFFAYPAHNHELRNTIEEGARLASSRKVQLQTWPEMDIFGASIPDEVRESIKKSRIVYCDITIANENVYYELGFAVGLGKKVGPTLNESFAGSNARVRKEGLFDNIGYRTYQNRNSLKNILESRPKSLSIEAFHREINHGQPIFVLDTSVKTDFRNAIIGALRKAKAHYRSYDPVEVPRLSVFHTITEVSSSLGIVVPFLGDHIEGYEQHNLRAAFVAGLAHGIGRPTLLLKLSNDKGLAPTDYRNNITSVADASHIDEVVRDFVREALASAKSLDTQKANSTSMLRSISLGAVAAENEFRSLEQYFVETAEFVRTMRGEVKVVTGRKGSGKTAIFYMARDKLKRRKSCFVIDLKPESHQLVEFRENLAKTIEAGVIDHSLAAFWHYIILSEILVKLVEVHRLVASNDQRLSDFAERAKTALNILGVAESGDFTARLNSLVKYFLDEVSRSGKRKGILLDELTNVIYSQAIPALRKMIIDGTHFDDEIVVLFDNIDKGWPTTGVQELDTRVVRLLLETLNKISQEFASKQRHFQTTVFLRNDIFEILISATPDRGKSGRVNIDWTDREKLKQIILRRIQASVGGAALIFDEVWRSRFVSFVGERESFDFFVDHCLMRPRFLIGVIETAISNAINRGHSTVQESDCKDAVKQHAYSLLDDFGYEIRDVSGITEDVIYALVGCPPYLTSSDILERLKKFGLSDIESEDAFQLLLWYGAIGLHNGKRGDIYVYDVDYNMRRLQAEMKREDYDDQYVINPGLYVALQ